MHGSEGWVLVLDEYREKLMRDPAKYAVLLRRQNALHSVWHLELQEKIAEADRLLRAAYADTHPEDVPLDVLNWLNPERN
jgi:hypothetical protein